MRTSGCPPARGVRPGLGRRNKLRVEIPHIHELNRHVTIIS
ncbi:MAG TPA: hypothetical protein ACHBYY_05470 [Arsenophonus nasoniae]